MNKPRIRRRGGFWCVYRTPASPRPVIVGHEFARVCEGLRRMFPSDRRHAPLYTATAASVIVQERNASLAWRGGRR